MAFNDTDRYQAVKDSIANMIILRTSDDYLMQKFASQTIEDNFDRFKENELRKVNDAMKDVVKVYTQRYPDTTEKVRKNFPNDDVTTYAEILQINGLWGTTDELYYLGNFGLKPIITWKRIDENAFAEDRQNLQILQYFDQAYVKEHGAHVEPKDAYNILNINNAHYEPIVWNEKTANVIYA